MLSLVLGIVFLYIEMEKIVAIMLFIISAGTLLVYPTIVSYKCHVTKISLTEEYYVLFVKLKKEIMWSDVKYKWIVTAKRENSASHIVLYGENRKRLISFSDDTVGFTRIVKMAKSQKIANIK